MALLFRLKHVVFNLSISISLSWPTISFPLSSLMMLRVGYVRALWAMYDCSTDWLRTLPLLFGDLYPVEGLQFYFVGDGPRRESRWLMIDVSIC